MDNVIGNRVKMRQALKDQLIENDCKDHVDEFGDQAGTIIGYPFFDDLTTVDVRWDNGLRYMYPISELIMLNSK